MDHTNGQKNCWGYWLALALTIGTLVAVLGVNIFQGYIRWKVNQNFTLLGGNELEALTISGFALLAVLLKMHHSK